MTTSEKIAYLKGLCEGMGIGDDGREGKLFKVITEVLEALSQDMEETKDAVEDVLDSVEELSEDLSELEDAVYDDPRPEAAEQSAARTECRGCCAGGFPGDDDEDDEDDEDEPVFYSVECPDCGFRVTVDEDILAGGSFSCPECGEEIDFSDCTVDKVNFDEDEDGDENTDGD